MGTSSVSLRWPFFLLAVMGILLVVSLFNIPADPFARAASGPTPSELDEMAYEFEEATKTLLRTWYPRVVDEAHGGYITDFNADWEADGPQHKMIVTQARHIWTASQAGMRYPDEPMFLDVARHGYEYLRDSMWDEAYGGFYTRVAQDGTPIGEGQSKTAYGNAFGLYALAAYAKASGDPEVLAFAQDAFNWLEAHSHDPEYGGYFQHLNQDGSVREDPREPPKDQNSSIHLLEAFTALYEVWPDQAVRDRLEEMLLLIRDTMVHEEQYLQLYFEADWTPVSFRDAAPDVREANYWMDHVSVGHDIETAFLMLEAAQALGRHEDKVMQVGKSMVDHALSVGWDDTVGGFYDIVYYLPEQTEASVIKDTKTWWAQAEGLNSLLLMHTLYPDHEPAYFDRFTTLWGYANTYLIDLDRGGWYSGGLDKEPELFDAPKSHIWKGSYHTVRSLMHSADMLHELAK